MDQTPIDHPKADSVLLPVLARLRAGFASDMSPPASVRRARLDRLAQAIEGARDALAAAASADFGYRPTDETLLLEVTPVLAAIRHTRSHVAAWMRPERRGHAPEFISMRNSVLYQPLGVVGIMSPWNYPILLSLGPLVDALAAGNRAMLKPSELTPAVNAVLARLLADAFSPDEVALVEGGPEVGAAFAALPLDHLVFTGSTAIGRKVMAAAAERLTPLTLELGGKSPAIVVRGADLAVAARDLVFGKLINAGQTCIAPDYVLAPREDVDTLAGLMLERIAASYPAELAGRDYASLIGERYRERLDAALAAAEEEGAPVLRPAGFVLPDRGTALTPAIVLDPPQTSLLMTEEIFGPVLPIIGYDRLEAAIDRVNEGERPLALYVFARDTAAAAQVIAGTRSGNVTVNGTILHIAQNDIPFGGIGASGVGAYHGRDGFRRLSHARGITRIGWFDPIPLGAPPYGWLARWLGRLVGRH